MFCPFCGFRIDANDALFCPRCGRSVEHARKRFSNASRQEPGGYAVPLNTIPVPPSGSADTTDTAAQTQSMSMPVPRQPQITQSARSTHQIQTMKPIHADKLIGLNEDDARRMFRELQYAYKTIDCLDNDRAEIRPLQTRYHRHGAAFWSVAILAILTLIGVGIAGMLIMRGTILPLNSTKIAMWCIAALALLWLLIGVVLTISRCRLRGRLRPLIGRAELDEMAIAAIHKAVKPLESRLPQTLRNRNYISRVLKMAENVPTFGEAMSRCDNLNAFDEWDDVYGGVVPLDIGFDEIHKAVGEAAGVGKRPVGPSRMPIMRIVLPAVLDAVSAMAVIVLCLMLIGRVIPQQVGSQADALAYCNEAYRNVEQGQAAAEKLTGLSGYDTSDSSALASLNSSVDKASEYTKDHSCSTDYDAMTLRTVGNQADSYASRLNKSIDEVNKSLKSPDEYTLDDMVSAVSEGSYRSIVGNYCRKDGDCVYINDWGVMTKSVGVGDAFANGQYTSDLSVTDDLDSDTLYQDGIGFSLVGPDSDLTCDYGSGSDCEDLPQSDIITHPVTVDYFREGISTDYLYDMCSGMCSSGFVPPDTDKPFLRIPYLHGAVGSANDPSDQNVYYLQDESADSQG
ncbi:zinc ribbon domain-containing protein [Bifidobacterium miconisargentati]|uniref:zinc ribbon domain-containing protein n=1 Tax=Bifidobacterium miconisargentati TaxID=2834437 RepID=UPI001BDC02A4|nr:zinc ribbon domain-containing protein [Bifidobacterium miconisargentati]MBW3090600.1 zinc ribbon domain-containing protein [Bifidobacterium miconisargentati]